MESVTEEAVSPHFGASWQVFDKAALRTESYCQATLHFRFAVLGLPVHGSLHLISTQVRTVVLCTSPQGHRVDCLESSK